MCFWYNIIYKKGVKILIICFTNHLFYFNFTHTIFLFFSTNALQLSCLYIMTMPRKRKQVLAAIGRKTNSQRTGYLLVSIIKRIDIFDSNHNIYHINSTTLQLQCSSRQWFHWGIWSKEKIGSGISVDRMCQHSKALLSLVPELIMISWCQKKFLNPKYFT